jgi:hypothetical protein
MLAMHAVCWILLVLHIKGDSQASRYRVGQTATRHGKISCAFMMTHTSTLVGARPLHTHRACLSNHQIGATMTRRGKKSCALMVARAVKSCAFMDAFVGDRAVKSYKDMGVSRHAAIVVSMNSCLLDARHHHGGSLPRMYANKPVSIVRKQTDIQAGTQTDRQIDTQTDNSQLSIVKKQADKAWGMHTRVCENRPDDVNRMTSIMSMCVLDKYGEEKGNSHLNAEGSSRMNVRREAWGMRTCARVGKRRETLTVLGMCVRGEGQDVQTLLEEDIEYR